MKKVLLSLLFSLPLLFYASGQYVTNGTAISTGGDCFRLTQALNGQGGSVWFQNKISLASDFTVNATVYLGNNNAGADGLAFVLQPVCSGLGGIGGGLGYMGISPSLAVELDTWQNADPPEDHIGLMINGNVNHIFPNPGVNVPQGFATLPNIENGLTHTLKIEWFAGPQNLKVTFNGTLYINYTGDIVANIFGGNRNVFWGFTAATGAANNEHRVCINSANFTQEGSFTVTKPSCPSHNNGAIDLNPAGGIAPFTYLWSNGATTEDLTGISAGTYSVTVTDNNGCKSVFSILVDNELDVTTPVIICPADVTINNTPGLCSGTTTLAQPTVTDNCSGIIDGVEMVKNGNFNLGAFAWNTCSNTVEASNFETTYGGSNGSNRVAEIDHQPATLCQSVSGFVVGQIYQLSFLASRRGSNTAAATVGTIVNINGGALNKTVNRTNTTFNLTREAFTFVATQSTHILTFVPTPGWSGTLGIIVDDISINNGTITNDAPATYPVGNTIVTWTATDASGNTATCTQNVTVADDEAPVAKCKPVTVTLSGGAASISADDVNDGSSDNCGIQSITVSPFSFDCSNIGDNEVSLIVTDIAGNVSTCTAVVTVVGEIPTCSIASIPSSNTFTGGVSTNLYLGYGPQSTTLEVSAPASGAPYTYAWSGGTLSNYNTANPVFTATTAGTFTFTVEVTNKYGCKTTCSITICVTDIRVPGTDEKKVYICHIPEGNPGNPQTLSISVNAVPAHIGLHGGDRLGTCDMLPCTTASIVSQNSAVAVEDAHEGLKVIVAPNPTSTHFTFRLHSENETPVSIRIVNGTGQVLESANKVNPNGTIQMGSKLLKGMYFAEFMQGTDRQVIKVMKMGSR